MPDSPKPISHGEIKHEDQENSKTQKRPCDFCGESIALLYCRADTAKLCLSCDRQVHSTNLLFTKHTRSLLCDSCHSSPSSIFCSTDSSVFCQNCDWETHNSSLSSTHDRRPLEGFTGCPSVVELLSILGFEDLSKKGLLGVGGGGDGGLVGKGLDSYGSDDGFSDYLVWETPSIVSFDDLISSSGSEHNYQAMGVPPLPKNRNAACGAYKDELLRQLREMAKSEPNLDDDAREIIKPLNEFQSLVPERNTQPDDLCAGFEHKQEQSLYSSYEDLQANAFQWCCDSGDFAEHEFPSTRLGNYNEANCVVPDKDLVIVHSPNHDNVGHEGQSLHTAITETLQVFPTVPAREINIQERDSAISRYKEKKKSRRYDKHIRYESRKVRAESRTRIRGRFAKIDR